MKNIYICSPLRGDYEANTSNAIQYCKMATMLGVNPIAPHIYYPQFMDDTNQCEREIGTMFGLELLKICSEVWIFGNISAGMSGEIKAAQGLNIPVVDGFEAMRVMRIEEE